MKGLRFLRGDGLSLTLGAPVPIMPPGLGIFGGRRASESSLTMKKIFVLIILAMYPLVQPAGAQVDILPHSPGGWDSAFVVNQTEGERREAALVAGEAIYVSIAWEEANRIAVPDFSKRLLLDGEEIYSSVGDLGSGYKYWDSYNIGTLDPGTYELRFELDDADVIPESDEDNNALAKTIEVLDASSLPDLAPYPPSGWDDPIVSAGTTGSNKHGPVYDGDNLYVNFAVINQGLADASIVRGRVFLNGEFQRNLTFPACL